jgi:hypothetical protein
MNRDDIQEGDVLTIDGEEKVITDVTLDYGGSGGTFVEIEDSREEYVLFDDAEEAGEAAADYWRELAQDDPKEFIAIIGEERLVKWALGQSDEYGINGLESFCEVTATVPEEEWAKYDGVEHETTVKLMQEKDDEGNPQELQVVAYRHN